jgi:hypothetical protein
MFTGRLLAVAIGSADEVAAQHIYFFRHGLKAGSSGRAASLNAYVMRVSSYVYNRVSSGTGPMREAYPQLHCAQRLGPMR